MMHQLIHKVFMLFHFLRIDGPFSELLLMLLLLITVVTKLTGQRPSGRNGIKNLLHAGQSFS